MHLARTIVALVMALSMATLPIAGAAVSVTGGIDQVASEATMVGHSSGTVVSSHDCCADDAEANPSDQPCDQCPIAFCAHYSVSIASAVNLSVVSPIVTGSRLPIPLDQVASLRSASPFFRPPRV